MYLNESTSGFLSFSLITYKVSIYQWHSFHNGICNKLTLTLEPLFLQCLYDHPVYVTRYCCHHSRGCWKFKEWSSYSPGRFILIVFIVYICFLGETKSSQKRRWPINMQTYRFVFQAFFLFQHVKFTIYIVHVNNWCIIYAPISKDPLLRFSGTL